MHLAIYFTTLGGGGTERVLVRLADEFVRRGHRVDFVLMRLGDAAYTRGIHPGVHFVDLAATKLSASLPALWRYLRRERPDVVISAGDMANGFSGWAGSLLHPKPVLIFTHHHGAATIFGNLAGRRCGLLTWLLRQSHRLADAVVGVSEGVACNIRRMPSFSPQQVYCIYNPSWHPSIEEEARKLPRCAWLERSSTPVILGVGRLEQQKDFSTLLRAFALLRARREARLLIVGEGSERRRLENLVTELRLDEDVYLPGWTDNPFSLMASASVFALSSAHEGLPTVLIEAMACGTPVVSTDCPTGPSEILDGGRFGSLVPVGDQKALAVAIEEQLDDPTAADVLRARAREFSAEASATAYLNLAETLLGRKTRRS